MDLNYYFSQIHHFRTILHSLIIFLLFSCSPDHNKNLNEYQKAIINKIKPAETSKDFLNVYDTIFIKLDKDLILDTNPIICATPNRYIIVNSFMKNIIIIDTTGNVINIFGSDGEGPGEFRNVQSVCVDEKSNIYLFDNSLGRISKYTGNGVFVSFIKIKELNQYIRHISAYKNYVFFHHAPINDFNGFVTRSDSAGNNKTFLPKLNGFEPYYERGFLDGALIRDNLGNVYETNTYDLLIKKISDKGIKIFDNDELDFNILSSTKKTDYNLLVENYRNATIPINLYLIDNNQIIIQELLFFNNKDNNRKVNRVMLLYDTSGIFLGQLETDDQHSFDSSDGKYLIKLIDPTLYPDVYKNVKLPFIIRYTLN